MALLILALLQRIFLMSSLMLLLVWLIFFMVLIKLLPILGTISGKTVKLMVLALPSFQKLDRKSGSAGMPRPISYAVFCLKKKKKQKKPTKIQKNKQKKKKNQTTTTQQP